MPVTATDPNTTQVKGNGPPYTRAVALTKHDTDELAEVSNALFVGGAGAVAVKLQGSSTTVVFPAVPAGTTIQIRVRQLMSTSTDATSIVALY